MWLRISVLVSVLGSGVALSQDVADAGLADAGVPAAVRTVDAPVTVTLAMGRGLTVAKGDALSFNVRGRVQLRDVVTIADATSNELSLRTARFVFSGKVLSPDVQYLVHLGFGANDFEAGVPSPVLDAYVDYTGWRDLQLRVGQFFVPFDRARTIREFALQLVDRQQVVQELNLDRDLGLVASSQDLFGWGGRLAYSLGFFSGEGRNRVAAIKDPGFLYVARVSVKPFGAFDDDVEGDLTRTPHPHLAVAVAAAYNQSTSRQKSTFGNTLTLGGFDQLHLDADVVFKFHGFSLLAEALLRQANAPMHEAVVNGATVREYSRSAWGYLVQAGYMLTDQVEVAARWDQLRFLGGDPTLATLAQQQGRELGAGVNVYLNGHLAKVQADWAVRFGEGAAPPTHVARVMLDVSF